MAGLVDYDAVILDLRGALQQRPSWGRSQVLALIDDLEQRHRIDESADAATLRRFGAHLQDSFMGLLPPRSATPDPLPADDRSATSVAMDDGAASDHHHQGGDECQPTPLPTSPTSPPAQACQRVADQALAAARPLAALSSS